MGLFNNMLKSGESLFKNEVALDFEFVPKNLPYRENQQKQIARCIQPLLEARNGRNALIYGPPGIGKTAAVKWIFRELEEESDETYQIYINCWQKNTTFKIIVEICHQLGYRFTQNKRTEELFNVIKEIVNKKAAIFCFDEIDKTEDFDFLYMLLEDIFRSSILLITNYKSWIADLDERIRSRLMPEHLPFEQYNPSETRGILQQRVEYSFIPSVWEESAFDEVVMKTADLKDIRSGLFLLREAGLAAEENISTKIKLEHADKAISKLEHCTIKNSDDLEDDEQNILEIVKSNSGKKIGELFKIYEQQGGKITYKTFQRKIKKLNDNKFISTIKTSGGIQGNTTIVEYDTTRKLTEY